jgi:hypothetical protein
MHQAPRFLALVLDTRLLEYLRVRSRAGLCRPEGKPFNCDWTTWRLDTCQAPTRKLCSANFGGGA